MSINLSLHHTTHAVIATLIPAVVMAQAQTTVPTLPEVQVRGAAEQETATGPVQGYTAKRAASASKADTALIETPQSVSVVTRDQIVDQGANSIQEALGYAAGVRSDAYGIDSRTDTVRIRGSSPDTYLDGLRQSFDYYTSTTRTEPYTLERIEVLRGPSAMLYGQGSTAGIINMVSKRPQPEFQGEVGVQGGNFDRKQIQADLTGPVTADGQWLYRIVALKRDAGTQVDYVDDDRTVVAPSLTWRPSASTSLTLQGLWQDDKSGSTAQFMPWAGMQTPNPNGRVPTRRFIGEPDHDRYDSERRSIGWLFEHRFNDNWAVSQGFRHARNTNDYFSTYADSFSLPGGWALDPVNERIIGRYGSDSVTKVNIDTLDQHLKGNFQTGIVKHDMLVGFDWTRYRRDRRSGSGFSSIDAYSPVYGNYTPPELTDEPRFKQRQAGVYLQDQMKFGSNWIVVAGLRNDHARSGLDGQHTDKDSATSKRLGIMYAADNGWSPYVNYSESFTPVASTTVAGVNGSEIESYRPIRGEQIEAGIKHESADGRNLFTAAVYHLKEKNRLVSDPSNPLSSLQTGKTNTKGLELEWRGSPTRTIDLIAHYNYIAPDKELEGIPRHQAAVWGKWRFAVAGVDGFAVGAGTRWMSSFKDGVAPTTPSVVLFDSMLSYETNHWRYALNVNNLTDKTYIATCLSRGDCWYGARRSVVASATYRF